MVRTSIGVPAALWLVMSAAACAGPAQNAAVGEPAVAKNVAAPQSPTTPQNAPVAESATAKQSAPVAQGSATRNTAALAQTAAVAPTKGSAQSSNLRVEWEFDSARGDWQNACGTVHNDTDMPARRVMLRFDGYDGEGKKVSSRSAPVVGDVPPRGSAIFCLQVKTGASRYQVSVPGVDWGFSAERASPGRAVESP